MLPTCNIFHNNKAPVDNDLSLAARRYQQANLHESGIRLLSDYPIHLQTSTLRIVSGVKVGFGREVGFIIAGGLR